MQIRYSFKKFKDLTPVELYDLSRLRQEIFVVEQDCVYLDNDDLDQLGYHLMGYDELGLCSYTRILPPGTSFKNEASIGRVVNHPRIRKKQQGVNLMSISIQRAISLFPGKPIKISAQTYLQKFYEKMGFVKVGNEYLEDGIPHIPMLLSS